MCITVATIRDNDDRDDLEIRIQNVGNDIVYILSPGLEFPQRYTSFFFLDKMHFKL